VQHLGLVALVVRDYAEARDWYVDVLGFDLAQDSPIEGGDQAGGRRWVVVRPPGAPDGPSTGLLLARAETPEQLARVGDQTGGRVGLFLYTSDFAADHARLLAAGVRFLEQPRHEPYGSVAVFADLYGNRWDLLQPA
jgi:catechol 2,3-dioxygenase-like lactoylglutathione lyase family enzyme